MASSFKLFTDSGLTTPLSSPEQLLHYTNASEGDIDTQLWFGSAETADTRELRAASNPGVDQITLTPTYIGSTWASATAYSLGDSVRPTTPDGRRYEVTQAGTSGGTEPTFNSTIGSTTSDGTVTWTSVADDHNTTEITLALSEAALDTNTAGASLDLGTTISSGSANAVSVWVRVTNSVLQVSDTIGNAEIGININNCNEYSI